MAIHGGKRKGAGRKKGGRNAATLEKQAIQAAFNQRVMTHADALFQAQLQLAVGSVQIFRVDEVEDGNGKTKRVHVLVTNSDEAKVVLDAHGGESGLVGDDYYFVSQVSPQNIAIESMLNRALGKPTDKHEHTGANGGPIEVATFQITTRKDNDDE